MTKLAAIQATFSDWRPVKSRGVLQLVLEVPVEQTKHVLDTLGAPIPGTEKWVGVALISPGSLERDAPRSGAESATPTPLKAGGDPGESKRERTLPEKVGMRCNDPTFREWLYRWSGIGGNMDVAGFVRCECGVKSRTEILPGTEAAERWLALETRFLEDTGQMAERRR
jgi:hypothetical protein